MPEGPFGGPRPFASSDLIVEVILSDPVLDIPSQDFIEREFSSRTNIYSVEFENREIDGTTRGVGRVGVDKPISDDAIDRIATEMAEVAHNAIPAEFEQTIIDVQVTAE